MNVFAGSFCPADPEARRFQIVGSIWRAGSVWVLEPNARRSAPLIGEGAPQPVLYALDAMTLRPLWKSEPGQLHTSGKYNEPAIARGTVLVGTDRIQAIGLPQRNPC